jgi:hypothetical protein
MTTLTAEVGGEVVASATLERNHLAPGVRAIPIREQGLVGAIGSIDTKPADWVEKYSPSAPWRRPDGWHDYAEGLWTVLTQEPLNSAQVVLLPEYCVPLPAVTVLLDHLQAGVPHTGPLPRLLVLGSHLDERGYGLRREERRVGESRAGRGGPASDRAADVNFAA